MQSLIPKPHFLQKITISIFAFFAINVMHAQTKQGFDYHNNCLQINFKSSHIDSSCESVAWFIGNAATPISKQTSFNYTFSKSGSYNVCMSVYNFCKKTDTSYCRTVKVEACDTCHWKQISIGHTAYKNICGKLNFEATAPKDSCITVEYFFDGKWHDGRVFDRQLTKNGTYKYGFRFTNNCTGCDTTLYKWAEINCFTHKTCNWSQLNIGYQVTAGNSEEDCRKYKLQAKGYEDSCLLYKMKVVYENNVLYQEMGRIHTYTFAKDGYYNVCFWAKNECLNCDTWICKTIFINCKTAESNLPSSAFLSPGPNPVDTELNLYNPTAACVNVYDATGRLWFHKKIQPNAVIDLSPLSSGTYILRIQNDNGPSFSHQLIKN